MQAVGFDNQKYLKTQSEQIQKRIAQFGGKLYLEFGGKLFDDYHASRVLPGFQPDSKIRMLQKLQRRCGDRHRHQRRRTLRKTRCGATWASPMTRMCCG